MVVKQALVAASKSDVASAAATSAPITKSVARRFVAGTQTADAVAVAAELAASGMHCSIEYLGPQVTSVEGAREVVTANLRLLEALNEADLLDRAELSVKLSDLGLDLDDGFEIAEQNARRVVQAATEHDTFVTIDTEKYESVDATFHVVERLRREFPKTGMVVQSCLRRSDIDCRQNSAAGNRVRLVKGAFSESSDVAFTAAQDIDLSYVRCMKTLMSGEGTPLIATHDPRLIEIATALAVRTGRERHSYEFQMLYGVRSEEQMRLATTGERVRVFVPYGPAWYPYLVRRMAEKPANLALFLRALAWRG